MHFHLHSFQRQDRPLSYHWSTAARNTLAHPLAMVCRDIFWKWTWNTGLVLYVYKRHIMLYIYYTCMKNFVIHSQPTLIIKICFSSIVITKRQRRIPSKFKSWLLSAMIVCIRQRDLIFPIRAIGTNKPLPVKSYDVQKQISVVGCAFKSAWKQSVIAESTLWEQSECVRSSHLIAAQCNDRQ